MFKSERGGVGGCAKGIWADYVLLNLAAHVRVVDMRHMSYVIFGCARTMAVKCCGGYLRNIARY